MDVEVKPGRGSERVKAWVYTILNPTIESLRREVKFLGVGNLTWRVHNQRCEYIRPIEEIIDNSQQPNFEDFLAEFSKFWASFSEHDAALNRLEAVTAEYVDSLQKSPEFQKRLAESLGKYEASRPSHPTYPDLSQVQGKSGEVIAEFLVNNTKSVPRHYTFHNFWKEYGHAFHDFTKDTRPLVSTSAEALLGISGHIESDMEALRLSLVRKYDIPAAPIADVVRPLPAESELARLRQ